MKPQVADYQYKLYAMRIVARDDTTVRFVAYPHDLRIGAEIYLADPGYEFSGFAASSNLSPSTIDLDGILSAAGISRDQIASGVWDSAKCYSFATTWVDPQEDEEPIAKFIFGKAHLIDDKFSCEVMQLIDAVNQDVGRTVTPVCDLDFGDEFCTVDLALFTYTGTITSVADRGTFSDSGRVEADGFFDNGTIKFNTGDNSQIRAQEIQTFAAGEFSVFLPFHYLPQVGDEYTVVKGCAKTRPACMDYDNIINFGGFPDQPTSTMVTKIGGQ